MLGVTTEMPELGRMKSYFVDQIIVGKHGKVL